MAEARGLPAEKARILSNEINLSATFGLTSLADKQATLLLALLEKEHISFEELQPSLIGQLDAQPMAWTFALSGDATRAQMLADDFARKFPQDTIFSSVWLPLVRATLELKRGESAGAVNVSDRAVQLLPPSHQYEAALNFRPTWVRGLAYLQAKNGARQRRVSKNHRSPGLGRAFTAPMAHSRSGRAAICR